MGTHAFLDLISDRDTSRHCLGRVRSSLSSEPPLQAQYRYTAGWRRKNAMPDNTEGVRGWTLGRDPIHESVRTELHWCVMMTSRDRVVKEGRRILSTAPGPPMFHVLRGYDAEETHQEASYDADRRGRTNQ